MPKNRYKSIRPIQQLAPHFPTLSAVLQKALW